jgi:hypothetical protein
MRVMYVHDLRTSNKQRGNQQYTVKRWSCQLLMTSVSDRRRLWPDLRYHPDICLGELRKAMRVLVRNLSIRQHVKWHLRLEWQRCWLPLKSIRQNLWLLSTFSSNMNYYCANKYFESKLINELGNNRSRHWTIYKRKNQNSREKITQSRIRKLVRTANERVLVY